MTETQIANLALSQLGHRRITSLGDTTPEATLCDLHYETVRDSVLRDFPWSFAIRHAEPTQVPESPSWEFSHAFQLPSDPYCLRVVATDHDRVGTPWVVEGRLLLISANRVRIKYIARIIDTTQYDPMFVQAFATRLAAEIAYSLTRKSDLQKERFAEYLHKLEQAAGADSQEHRQERLDDGAGDLLMVR